MATEVYLVRHGETMFNQLNKVQGWADSPLTVKGINDLKITASKQENQCVKNRITPGKRHNFRPLPGLSLSRLAPSSRLFLAPGGNAPRIGKTYPLFCTTVTPALPSPPKSG